MIIKRLVYCALLILIWCFIPIAEANPISGQYSISEAVAQADIIVVARVTTISPNTQEQTTKPSGTMHDLNGKEVPFYVGQDAFMLLNKTQPSGNYTFMVLQAIKGHASSILQVHLPHLLAYYYGDAKIRVGKGDVVLLFLKLDHGQENVLSQTVPVIPLANTKQPHPEADMSNQSRILSLLSSSFIDPVLRQANTHLLRFMVDPQIPAILAGYLNDPNPQTRSNVLFCLAINQQVSVIPLIVQLRIEQKQMGRGTDCIEALEDFHTAEAVPYLNPLLSNADYEVRLNTMLSLARLADQTSVPYLMLALRDPDPQKVIPSSAWGLLHKVVPALKRPTEASDTFYKNRQAETKVLYDWWNDELSGKHVPKTPEVQQMLSRTLPADAPLAVLNTSLFEPSSKLRRTAMYRLQKAADATSIPYLVLALQDPDGTVAYGAYETLHRLVPSLGEAQTAEAFGANQEAVTKPVYAWWSDYLGGKPPVIPMPPGGLIPLPNGK